MLMNSADRPAMLFYQANGFRVLSPGKHVICAVSGEAVALEALRFEGKIRTAAVLDLDLHYGNGTASLAVTRPWLRALSIYGNDYRENTCHRDVSVRHHTDGENHFSVPMIPSGGSDRGVLMEALDQNLGWLIADGRPDILLYQAGADPLRDDPYSPLDLSHEDLMERDRRVFEFAKSNKLPVAWVLAGGYSKDIRKVVQVHVNTALVWREIFG